MAVRRGCIRQIEWPPTRGQRSARVTLNDGSRVYVPRALLEAVASRQPSDEEFVFCERGLLGRVGWMGTVGEAIDARARGVINAREAEQGAVPRPLVYGREVAHVRAGLIRIVCPPSPDEVPYLRALAALDEEVSNVSDQRSSPAARVRRAAEEWLRTPFEPFEIAEQDWLWLERTIGAAAMSRMRLFG